MITPSQCRGGQKSISTRGSEFTRQRHLVQHVNVNNIGPPDMRHIRVNVLFEEQVIGTQLTERAERSQRTCTASGELRQRLATMRWHGHAKLAPGQRRRRRDARVLGHRFAPTPSPSWTVLTRSRMLPTHHHDRSGRMSRCPPTGSNPRTLESNGYAPPMRSRTNPIAASRTKWPESKRCIE